jgi:hypothetical protein
MGAARLDVDIDSPLQLVADQARRIADLEAALRDIIRMSSKATKIAKAAL